MTSRIFYSAQYHSQHCTLHAFEQFGALYMHIHDAHCICTSTMTNIRPDRNSVKSFSDHFCQYFVDKTETIRSKFPDKVQNIPPMQKSMQKLDSK